MCRIYVSTDALYRAGSNSYRELNYHSPNMGEITEYSSSDIVKKLVHIRCHLWTLGGGVNRTLTLMCNRTVNMHLCTKS